MKKTNNKKESVLARLVKGAAVLNANSTCAHVYYQPKAPEAVKKLRKF